MDITCLLVESNAGSISGGSTGDGDPHKDPSRVHHNDGRAAPVPPPSVGDRPCWEELSASAHPRWQVLAGQSAINAPNGRDHRLRCD
jgi:hypothetical protein